MKLLTFAIPCYNSQDYMEHCIDSILPGGDDVEILIIDDGSRTAQQKLLMPMKQNTRESCVRFIRKTVDMEKLSMPESVMRPVYSLKLWTVMTG